MRRHANFDTVSFSSSEPNPSASPASEVERTVVFIDLAGFTALVEAHGDAAAVEVADQLVAVASAHLGEHGLLIKSIGDAVMLGFTKVDAALRTVSGILDDLAGRPSFPFPSTGMHHGTVVQRDGDLFGRRVNVAARLAALAGPGEVLATAPVARVATQLGVEVVELGAQRLRNIPEPVPTYRLELVGGGAAEVDPVCRMRVVESPHQLTVDGRLWHFCSQGCLDRFVRQPSDFT